MELTYKLLLYVFHHNYYWGGITGGLSFKICANPYRVWFYLHYYYGKASSMVQGLGSLLSLPYLKFFDTLEIILSFCLVPLLLA